LVEATTFTGPAPPPAAEDDVWDPEDPSHSELVEQPATPSMTTAARATRRFMSVLFNRSGPRRTPQHALKQTVCLTKMNVKS
jgi:hypothetical protein